MLVVTSPVLEHLATASGLVVLQFESVLKVQSHFSFYFCFTLVMHKSKVSIMIETFDLCITKVKQK